MTNKKTLVIGASENPLRYSNMAIKSLLKHRHTVVGIGSRNGEAYGISFGKDKLPFENIHTVTMYVKPTLQEAYYDYIIYLRPSRIIFNPGTENRTLVNSANIAGIECIEACTLVMLNTGQY